MFSLNIRNKLVEKAGLKYGDAGSQMEHIKKALFPLMPQVLLAVTEGYYFESSKATKASCPSDFY